MSDRTISVGYVTRVEGETAIRVAIPERGGPDIEVKIFEPPRFFEGFLVGRRFDEVGDIVARICGICPVSHMTTAIRAIEKATGIKPSTQTRRLRRIACSAQIAASHLVHLYALAMPDYVGCQGLPDMLTSRIEDVQRLERMRIVVNDLTALIGGGRALHPIATVPGGFTRIPSVEDLRRVCARLEELRSDAAATVTTIAALDAPDYRRERNFLALCSEEGYALNRGRIRSSGGLDCDEHHYAEAIEETQVPYAMAKRLRLRDGGGPMVGALARLHLKRDRLSARARELAEEAGFERPDASPFHNNLAQAIELAQCIEICIEELEKLDPHDEEPARPSGSGRGSAVTEAPRGLLYHAYEVNHKGVVDWARIITPTVHNFLSLEEDMRGLVAEHADLDNVELRKLCEMLVRAYDPCFSCSVH